MSPFIIFAIVLTIAYVLYYAAIITMDLVQKPKNDDEHAESIPVGGGNDHNDDAEPAPRAVTENPLTGGFDIDEHAEQPEEAPAEAEPEEATQVKDGIPEPPAPTPSTNETPAEPEAPIEPQPEEAPAPPKPEEVESVEGAKSSAEEEEDITDPHITPVDFLTKSPKKEPSNEPFDESKAFNPDKILPQYGVSETYGEKRDDSVEQRAHEVTQNLKDNKTSILGGLKTKSQISHELRTNSTQTNIEHKDVCTQC